MSAIGDSRRGAEIRLRPIPARKVVGNLTAAIAVGLAFSGMASAQSLAQASDPNLVTAAPLSLPSSRFPDRVESPAGLLPALGEKPAGPVPATDDVPDQAPDQIPDPLLLFKIPDLGDAPRAQVVEIPGASSFDNYFQPPTAAPTPDLPPVEAAPDPAPAVRQEPELLPAQSAERLLEDDIGAARKDLPAAQTPAETAPEPEPAAEQLQAVAEPAAAEPVNPDPVIAPPPPAPEIETVQATAGDVTPQPTPAPPDDSELAVALAETAAPSTEDAVAATALPADPLAPPPPPDLGSDAEEPQPAPETAQESSPVQTAALPPAGETPESSSFDTRVLFDAGSAEILPESRTLLTALAEKLAQAPETRIQLLAFAEKDPAAASAARKLSLSRARAVRGFLVEQGVPATRVLLRPLGEKYKDGPPNRVDVEALRR